jgi:hypothetical protein
VGGGGKEVRGQSWVRGQISDEFIHLFFGGWGGGVTKETICGLIRRKRNGKVGFVLVSIIPINLERTAGCDL